METNLWLIFITGLTTGGLSCLAVQGGLLASTMARRSASGEGAQPKQKPRRSARRDAIAIRLPGVETVDTLWPVIAFLVAKLLAYTLLGFVLGALGQAAQLGPVAQATMQIAAGVFMILTALNLLEVHPILRYFAIQPPRFLTRMVRDQATSESVFAPALLGAMTVFIPCGTTQGMMVLAISTADPLLGALVLFVFVLGTSPTFFALGLLWSQLKGRAARLMGAATAVLVLLLGLIAIDAGLKVAGSPYAPSRVITGLFNEEAGAVAAVSADGYQDVTIRVVDTGYSPRILQIEPNIPTRLHLDANGTYNCALAFTIPSLGIQELIAMDGQTIVELPPLPEGDVYFACSMGMYDGVIRVVNNS